MKYMTAFSILTAFSVLHLGCAPFAPKPVTRMAFPQAEYDALAKTGVAIVAGQAFLKTRGGDVKLAAGNEINLNPVTSYSLEWYNKSLLPNLPIVAPDPRLDRYIKTTIADASGRFTFNDVPAGEYFVTTKITWEVPSQYGLSETGAVVSKRIKVTDGDIVDVILTK